MLSYKKFFVIKMDEFEYDLTNTLTKELKQGGSIGSLVGKLVSKIGPLFIKHAPKILPGLALAGASGAISGATHKAVAGKGIGIYHDYGLMLTDSQKKRLQTAKDGITLRLTNDQLSGDDRLLLTKSQINKIEKHRQKGVGMDLKLSATQVRKQGGFLGALAAGLAAPLIGKVLGFGAEKKARGLRLPGTRTAKGLRIPGS